MLGFIVGLFIGACVGLMVAALMYAAGRGYRHGNTSGTHRS